MKIKLKLVGYLASTGLPNGSKGGEVSLPNGATVKDLLRSVDINLPTPSLIVREGSLIGLQEMLKDGDLIELIPPIGGG